MSDGEFVAATQAALARLDRALNPHLRGWTAAQRALRKELLAYRRSYHDYWSWCKVTPWFDAEGHWHWNDALEEEVWTRHSPADQQEALAALSELEGLCRAQGANELLASVLALRANLVAAFPQAGPEAREAG